MRSACITAVLSALMVVAVAGCNTVEGVGKDMKAAGEKIEGAAKKDDKSDAKSDGDAATDRSSEKY